MNIFAGKRIIPGMDITELLSTNDPDTLRQLALSLLEENRQKDASLSEKDHQIHQLKEALMLARQQRFGRQAESFSGLQRSLFEEDVDADIASAETQLARLLPETEEKKARPARKPLPANPCRRTCHAKIRLSDLNPAPARTAASRCAISVMKSANGWTTSRRSSW